MATVEGYEPPRKATNITTTPTAKMIGGTNVELPVRKTATPLGEDALVRKPTQTGNNGSDFPVYKNQGQ